MRKDGRTARRGRRRRKQLLYDVKERDDTGNSKSKFQIALCGELALKKATYRS
jgi:hypothetical protein